MTQGILVDKRNRPGILSMQLGVSAYVGYADALNMVNIGVPRQPHVTWVPQSKFITKIAGSLLRRGKYFLQHHCEVIELESIELNRSCFSDCPANVHSPVALKETSIRKRFHCRA